MSNLVAPEDLGKAKSTDKNAILQEARERHKLGGDAMRSNWEEGKEEIRFSLGNDQWSHDEREERGDRPTLVINRIVPAIDQVVGDQRQNRPEIKFRPDDDKADAQVATGLNGWVRKIRANSGMDVAIDYAFEHAVAGRMGFWRVETAYEGDDTFDQTARIGRILSPWAVRFDPAAKEWDKSDAMWCFVDEAFTEEEFKRRWPKAGGLTIGDAADDWQTSDGKWIVTEYWRKVAKKGKLHLLDDGRIVTDQELKELSSPEGMEPQVVNSRESESFTIERYLVNGSEVLEGPEIWPGKKYIPIVGTYGKEAWVDGETKFRSMTTYSKDPQQSYNYAHSTAVETMKMTPSAPYVGTVTQFEGVEALWDDAIKKGYTWLPYNPDPQAPGPPARQMGPVFPPGLKDLMMISADEIKATTSHHDASLGARGNETSGKAILARQREGDVASFPFLDNLNRALVYTGKVLLDIAPAILDTHRKVQTLNEDGSEGQFEFNKPVLDLDNRRVNIENDISKGRYSVTVTTGPSYSTQRVETASNLVEIGQAAPQMAPLAIAMMAEHLDFPGADRFAKACRMMLPQPIQQALMDEGKKEDEGPVQAVMHQVQELGQNVQKMAQVLEVLLKKQQGQDAADQSKANLDQAKADGVKLDNATKIHNLMKDAGQMFGVIPGGAPPGGPEQGQPTKPPQQQGGFY